jgi:hypothetical protein
MNSITLQHLSSSSLEGVSTVVKFLIAIIPPTVQHETSIKKKKDRNYFITT